MNLELVTTRALITELLRRSDIGAIVMNQDRTEDTGHFIVSHCGPTLGVVGLMELAKSRIIDCHKEGIHNSEIDSIALGDDEDDFEDDFDDEEGYNPTREQDIL